MTRVEADPDLKTGIAQAADTPDKLDGRVTGQGRMVVVGDRSAEYRGQPVAQLFTDDAAKLPHRASHRRKRRLKTQHRLLRLQFGNESGGIDDVGAQNRYKPSFAIGIDALTDRRSAFGAPAVARTNCRLTRETMHSSAFNDCPGSPRSNAYAAFDQHYP